MRGKPEFDARSLRRTSAAESFPWLSRLVTLIHIDQSGVVSQAKTDAEKRAVLGGAGDRDLLLAAWPGEWSQDVFVVDDVVGARLAVGLPRKRVTGSAAPAPREPVDVPSYDAPGQLWRYLAQLSTLPVAGQRQLAERFADRGPDDDAVALLIRTDLDPGVRQLLLANVSPWRAGPLIESSGSTTLEALALLDQFPTHASVLEAALRRPDTQDQASQTIARLSYAEAAKLWLESHAWSPVPRQRGPLADGVLQVVLSKEPPSRPAQTGWGADRYDRSSLVPMLMKELSDDRRRDHLNHPEYGRLVQRAMLASNDLTDDELIACLPEVLGHEGPDPILLRYVQRFPQLVELGGARLQQAVAGLIATGWSPVQAARSGHWDVLLVAARLTDDPSSVDALADAAVYDRTMAPSAETWRDSRRYDLIDVLMGKAALADDRVRFVLDRLTDEHIEELRGAARKRGRLYRLCEQVLQARKPAPSTPSYQTETQAAPELPTDEDLSAMAEPQAVLRDLLRDRSRHRSTVVGHALDSAYMTDDLAWRLPVQELEQHPKYGPRLAAEVARLCGTSQSRWQAFGQSWNQPTQLLAATLFKRLQAAGADGESP